MHNKKTKVISASFALMLLTFFPFHSFASECYSLSRCPTSSPPIGLTGNGTVASPPNCLPQNQQSFGLVIDALPYTMGGGGTNNDKWEIVFNNGAPQYVDIGVQTENRFLLDPM